MEEIIIIMEEPPPAKRVCTDAVDSVEGGEEEVSSSQECSWVSPRETDVGISEYVSDHEGFFAILKRR